MNAEVDPTLVEPTILHSIDPRRTSLSHELVIFHFQNSKHTSADMHRQKVPITFTYQKNGTYPPIYVAGSFSNPPWQPQEMDVSIDQHGGHLFTKTVLVDDGSEIQYKFRIGLGNWWALDDNADTITDNGGNVNNVLRVSVNESQEAETKSPTPKIKELKEPTLNSGTQTPDVAKIAAEVADSAYAIDLTAPEPEISDNEAGRLGIRRMSNTPIDEVARTAMEVSVVAATLDNDDSESDDEHDENTSCPMFSHEFMGPPHENKDTSDRPVVTQNDDIVLEMEDSNFDNPQLEKLPSSDRSSIIAAMRRISTSIAADRTVIEGIPPSSIVPIFRQDRTNSPPEKPQRSPGTPPKSEPIDKPTLTTDPSESAYSHTSEASMSSLCSIAEGDELPNDNISERPDDAEATATYIQHPGPSWGSVLEHAVTSDSDDEGIAMRAKSGRELGVFQDRPPSLVFSPAISPKSNAIEVAEPSPKESTTVMEELSTPTSSKDALSMEEVVSKEIPSSTACRLPGTYESDGSNSSNIERISKNGGEVETQSTSPSIDPQSETEPKKPGADKKAAPSFTHLFQDSNKYPGWLETCYQVVLVKWLGGFAAWIYGRRHRTLITVGTAAIVVGVGVLWQNPIRI